MNINKEAAVFKSLANKTRLSIVKKLAAYDALHCSELSKTFRLSQPTLSHHFNILINAGVIHARKEATHMIYSLNKEYLRDMHIIFST